MKIKDTGDMPKFVTHFWDVSKKKLESRGHDVTSMGLSKRFARHYWEGRITHVQSGDVIIFHSISEMLAFIEKHRL